MIRKANKKAEVPIVILVLGVLILCVLLFANYSFFSQKEKKYANIEEVVIMEDCLSYIDSYNFYLNNEKLTGYSKEEIKNLPLFKEGKNVLIDSEEFLVCSSGGLKIKYPLL